MQIAFFCVPVGTQSLLERLYSLELRQIASLRMSCRLQFILPQINEVFGNSAAKRARVDADAHMIRASPGMRMDCVTQVQREQKEMYGVKMQSTREQWELANARLWLNNQIPGEHKSSTN